MEQCFAQALQTALGAAGQHFGGRQQQRGGHIGCPALGRRVKGAHGVDLVVKELAAHRLAHQRGEHVQDAAPQGELAYALHLVAAGIARRQEAISQRVQVSPAAHLQGYGQGGQQVRRQCPGHQGVGGGDGDGDIALGQGVQRRKTAALPVPGADGSGTELPLPA